MTPRMNNFKKALLIFLAEKGLTQRDLVKQIVLHGHEISRHHISRSEANHRFITLVASVLKVPSFYILMSPKERANWDALESRAAFFYKETKKRKA